MNKKYERYILPTVLPILLGVIWIYLTKNEIVASYLFPSPFIVLDTIFKFLGDGILLEDTWVSISRMCKGLG